MATPLELEQLYLAYLGRPSEPAALAYYASQTLAQVQAALNASAEARQVYGNSAGQIDAALVAGIYQHLFNRTLQAAEAQSWVGVASDGAHQFHRRYRIVQYRGCLAGINRYPRRRHAHAVGQ